MNICMVILLFFCTVHHSLGQTQTSRAIVKGTVQGNVKELVFESFFPNKLKFSPNSYQVPLDASGNFQVDIAVPELSEGLVSFNGKSFPLILKPGDIVIMDIANDKISFQGSGVTDNIFTQELYKRAELKSPQIDKRPLKESLEILNKFELDRKQFLNNYPDKQKLSPAFIAYYNIATIITKVRFGQHILSQKGITVDHASIPTEMKMQHSLPYLNQSKFLTHPLYLYVLQTTLHTKFASLPKATTQVEKDSTELAYIVANLSPKVRDYFLCFDMAIQLRFTDSYSSVKLEGVNRLTKDKNCIDFLSRQMTKQQIRKDRLYKPLGEDLKTSKLYDANQRATTLGEVIDKHRGEFIYLCIESVSCPTSQGEYTHIKRIERELAAYPFLFIHLFIEQPTGAAVKAYTDSSPNAYILQKSDKSQLHQVFDVLGTPRYMVIDQQGRLVSYNAARPSSPNLSKMLIDHLSKP